MILWYLPAWRIPYQSVLHRSSSAFSTIKRLSCLQDCLLRCGSGLTWRIFQKFSVNIQSGIFFPFSKPYCFISHNWLDIQLAKCYSCLIVQLEPCRHSEIISSFNSYRWGFCLLSWTAGLCCAFVWRKNSNWSIDLSMRWKLFYLEKNSLEMPVAV